MKEKREKRKKRHYRIRKTVVGTEQRPRLCVFRSSKHIYVQAVNDLQGKTIAAASTLSKELPEVTEESLTSKRRVAKAVGKLIGQKLQEAGVQKIVFDRGGFLYHGRVAALADGVRDSGFEF